MKKTEMTAVTRNNAQRRQRRDNRSWRQLYNWANYRIAQHFCRQRHDNKLWYLMPEDVTDPAFFTPLFVGVSMCERIAILASLIIGIYYHGYWYSHAVRISENDSGRVRISAWMEPAYGSFLREVCHVKKWFRRKGARSSVILRANFWLEDTDSILEGMGWYNLHEYHIPIRM